MRPAIPFAICAIALMFAAAFTANAQDAAIPPDVKAFAAQYVAAFNARDAARLQSLNLAQSLACITPENKDIYMALLSMQMRDRVPSNYLLSLMPVNENNLKARVTPSPRRLVCCGFYVVTPPSVAAVFS